MARSSPVGQTSCRATTNCPRRLPRLSTRTAGSTRATLGSTLRDLAKFETPKKVLLLENDFTIESGELTPTLKVKRRVVEQHYKDKIDAAYAAEDAMAAAIER